MNNLAFQLFFQFFQIGVLSFGGGYATLPFLYHISEKFHWYSSTDLTHMLAIASITPGPVGINVATYAGFSTLGIVGAIIATMAITLPSFICITIVSKMIDKFKTNNYIKISICGLKACGCALLTSVWIKLLFTSSLHLLGLLIFIMLLISTFIKKNNPIFYLATTACLGLVLGHFHLIGI